MEKCLNSWLDNFFQGVHFPSLQREVVLDANDILLIIA